MKPKLHLLEEHNEAFYVWYNALRTGAIGNNNLLLHFDDHADLRYPVLSTSVHDLATMNDPELQKFVRHQLHIDSFIVPTIYLGIVDELWWLRQGVQRITDSNFFVGSFNDEGKKFLPRSSETECLQSSRLFRYIKAGDTAMSNLDVENEKPVLLDIDLDYFSCCENPYIENEVVIEITEAEYHQFLHSPYHYLHFITANAKVVKYRSSFFYVLNDIREKYESRREVSEKEIINRLKLFINQLASRNIQPSLITICRSRYSGFTPRQQWQFIEKHLVSALNCLYDFDVLHIDSLFSANYSHNNINAEADTLAERL